MSEFIGSGTILQELQKRLKLVIKNKSITLSKLGDDVTEKIDTKADKSVVNTMDKSTLTVKTTDYVREKASNPTIYSKIIVVDNNNTLNAVILPKTSAGINGWIYQNENGWRVVKSTLTIPSSATFSDLLERLYTVSAPIGEGDVTKDYVDTELLKKVDKVEGKSLIDADIVRVMRSIDGGEGIEISADITANDIYASGEITDKNNNKLSKKVDKIEGKSLIDSDVADAFEENAEYGYQFDDGLKINGEVEAQDSDLGKHNVGNELKKLMNKAFPFTASASINTTLARKGNSESVTISNIKGEVEGVAQSVDIYIKENNSSYVKLADGVNSKTFSATDTTTYTIKVVSKIDGREAVITKTITFVYPTYYGFGANYSDVAVSGNAQTWTSARRTYTLSNSKTTACKFYLIVPASGVSVPSSFTMGGAPYVMNRTTQTINNISYYVFESGGTYATGGSVNIVAS